MTNESDDGRLIEKARRGERVTRAEAEYSMFDQVQDVGPHACDGRVILCYGDDDVSECANVDASGFTAAPSTRRCHDFK